MYSGQAQPSTPPSTPPVAPPAGPAPHPYAPTQRMLYEKADFFKIKDITLSYNLPKSIISKAKISNARVYCSLKNYITFSSVDNYDAEMGGSINWPLAKQCVIGVNLTF